MAATGNLTTELEAINEMLVAIQSSRVDSIDTSIHEVDEAQRTLHRVVHEIQMRGWSWNTQRYVEMSPNSGDEIQLAENIIQITAPWYWNGGRIIYERERKLYDATNNTFDHTENVFANIQFVYEFDDLPHFARHYAFIKAGRIFIQQMIGQTDFIGFQQRDEEEAHMWMREAEGEVSQFNMLQNISSLGITDRYGGIYR